MVKMFSVDWMAQSHSNSNTNNNSSSTPKEDRLAGAIIDDNVQTSQSSCSSRPHVPCMVQPRPPTSYEKKGYLQLKPKTSTTHRGHYSRQESSVMVNSPSSVSEISSSSSSNGYSSGYESEAASSECPSVEEEEGHSSSTEELDVGTEEDDVALHGRRVRTKFSAEQINRLERIFNKHKYLDASERVKTAEKLKLSETQVRTWFQNRRMKLKREVHDLRADFHLAPAAMFQNFHHQMQAAAVPQIQYPGLMHGGQRVQYHQAGFYPAMVPQFPMHQQQQQHMVSHHYPIPTHAMMHSPLFY